jgi:hypothetical protein
MDQVFNNRGKTGYDNLDVESMNSSSTKDIMCLQRGWGQKEQREIRWCKQCKWLRICLVYKYNSPYEYYDSIYIKLNERFLIGAAEDYL